MPSRDSFRADVLSGITHNPVEASIQLGGIPITVDIQSLILRRPYPRAVRTLAWLFASLQLYAMNDVLPPETDDNRFAYRLAGPIRALGHVDLADPLYVHIPVAALRLRTKVIALTSGSCHKAGSKQRALPSSLALCRG